MAGYFTSAVFLCLIVFGINFSVIVTAEVSSGANLKDEGKLLTIRADENIMQGGLSGLTSLLAALGIIKFKIVLSLITAFFIVALISKLLGGIGTITCGSLGVACPPGVAAFSAYSTYNPDYSSFEVYKGKSNSPSIFDSLYRRIDVMDMSFRMFGIEDEICRKKFVCLADNEAKGNRIFEYAMQLLGSNLAKYRDFDPKSPERRDCRQLYPQCTTVLPSEQDGFTNDSSKRVKYYKSNSIG
ncbi:hypothetical protein LSTR_LSTR014163 [Laodelphax striatellus]|uniref:Uncharacterized protein n=1 Tax=Laodelphax striatellus TaxID=195883 RepID=A0A482X1Y5_LAOST|nr:hypothetical protein LSTR_LSTR014163 [Laodelphax striatellus]